MVIQIELHLFTFGSDVYIESRSFDLLYTELLNSLQTWENGDESEFDNNALGLMYTLESEAKALMKMPIDPNNLEKSHFGSSFLLITAG